MLFDFDTYYWSVIKWSDQRLEQRNMYEVGYPYYSDAYLRKKNLNGLIYLFILFDNNCTTWYWCIFSLYYVLI